MNKILGIMDHKNHLYFKTTRRVVDKFANTVRRFKV